jgi:transaldolase
MKRVEELKVKIFADGAAKADMLETAQNPLVKGFTTNPTLMRKAGITDYEAFAKDILKHLPHRPISFEVFSDDIDEMHAQALKMAAWGENVYVKIPVTNTKGISTCEIIKSLASSGVKQNVTAIMTLSQVQAVTDALSSGPSAYVSVFAGRIADTGRDPMPIMTKSVEILSVFPQLELIWASPRELLNIFQADSIGCHIITVTKDILKKMVLVNKDLNEFSLETVKMFYEDAKKAGFSLETSEVI